MNYVDAIIAIPLIFFAFKGFMRGLVIELASLAGLILGIYVSYHFSDITMQYLAMVIHTKPAYQHMIAFAVTFILVLLIVHLIAKLIEKVVDLVALGFLNKLAGIVFGILKGALIISVVIFVIDTFSGGSLPENKDTNDSVLYKPVAALAPFVIGNIHYFKPEPKEKKADTII